MPTCVRTFLCGPPRLMRDGGQFGFLATNTIAQGDTREVGLDQLMADGCVIPRAVPSRPWPGTASLEVAHVWLRWGQWKTPFVLDDKPVSSITPFLTEPGTSAARPPPAANAGKSFIGSYVLGMGFVLMPEEARSLIERNPRNQDVLFPYINGEDINSVPIRPRDGGSSTSSIGLLIENRPLTATMDRSLPTIPTAWILSPRGPSPIGTDLRTETQAQGIGRSAGGICPPNSQSLLRYRWSGAGHRNRIKSKTLMPDFVSSKVVLDQTIVVLTNGTTQFFAIVASSLHRVWVLNYGATLRTDQRYNPSQCFENSFHSPTFSAGWAFSGRHAATTAARSCFPAKRA